MSNTNLKEHLVKFSQNWDSYVTECMTLKGDKLNFHVTNDHEVYQLIINTIVSEVKTLVDGRLYKVKERWS